MVFSVKFSMSRQLFRPFGHVFSRPLIVSHEYMQIKSQKCKFTQNFWQKSPIKNKVSIRFAISTKFLRYFPVRQSSMSMALPTDSLLKPSENVRGMTVLDKSAFNKAIKVPAIVVPLIHLDQIQKKLKAVKLNVPHLKEICCLEDTSPEKSMHKYIILDPTKVTSYSDLSQSVISDLSEKGLSKDDFKEVELTLTYENWTCHEVLQAVIPQSVSAFTLIGHICHFTLKDEVLPYKNLIGEVVLDKLRTVKTVVNKTSTIDNTYRSFQMELLAGEENYITQTKENGMTFELDFSKVYWNSRLGTEHQRIVDCVSGEDTVYDVFAGVGPFAIPAAKKKKAIVLANDLNPTSYEYLVKNVKLNKVKTGIQCFNMDGREFIRTVVKKGLLKQLTEAQKGKTSNRTHIIMNLPALAIEFLDVFKELLANHSSQLWFASSSLKAPVSSDPLTLPKVYCYCFEEHKGETIEKHELNSFLDKKVKERVKEVVGDSVDADLAVRYVRNVSQNKEMMLATFTLTLEILLGQNTDTDTGEPDAKRTKTETANAS